MASTLNKFGATALRSTCRVRPRQTYLQCRFLFRSYHKSQRYGEGNTTKASAPPSGPSQSTGSGKASSTEPFNTTDRRGPSVAAQAEKEPTGFSSSDPSPEEVLDSIKAQSPFTSAELATKEEEVRFQDLLDNPPPEHQDAVARYKARLEDLEKQFVRRTYIQGPIRDDPLQYKEGYMSMGMEDIEEDYGDDEFEGDDITATAHGELEQHREIREYARIAAWEMPLLSKFAKPFVPPDQSTPLRFRYTTYMGEEHPAQNKVVLEFCTADLPLTPAQRLKLIKLVGVRYDPQTDIVKASCEMFETQAQNKRYLGDLVDTLMAAAKGEGDTEAAKDSFEDVPVDFRHVRWKRKEEFPEAWKLTPERKAMLEAERDARVLKERQRLEEGKVVDGMKIIDDALKQPSMLAVGRTAGGLLTKGKAAATVASAKGKVKGSRRTLR